MPPNRSAMVARSGIAPVACEGGDDDECAKARAAPAKERMQALASKGVSASRSADEERTRCEDRPHAAPAGPARQASAGEGARCDVALISCRATPHIARHNHGRQLRLRTRVSRQHSNLARIALHMMALIVFILAFVWYPCLSAWHSHRLEIVLHTVLSIPPLARHLSRHAGYAPKDSAADCQGHASRRRSMDCTVRFARHVLACCVLDAPFGGCSVSLLCVCVS